MVKLSTCLWPCSVKSCLTIHIYKVAVEGSKYTKYYKPYRELQLEVREDLKWCLEWQPKKRRY